jgi:hypothetical protein
MRSSEDALAGESAIVGGGGGGVGVGVDGE